MSIEIEICPLFVGPSIRLSMHPCIISEPKARICFKFWLLLPLGHMLKPFLILEKKLWIFYEIFLFINMGPYGSQNFKILLLQITAESLRTFPKFSPQWSSKTMFMIFEIEILINFIRFC